MTRGAPSDAVPYSRTLRRLHLAMIVFVITLAATGLAIYFRKPLALQDFKLRLVYIHATTAYAFLIVLAMRFYLGLRGREADRWRHVFPRLQDLRRLAGVAPRTGYSLRFAGHSPLSRTIAGLLYLAFALNATTGIIRAGTDVYFPPLGPLVQRYVAHEGVAPSAITPGDDANVDRKRYAQVGRAKIPFGKVHIYGAFFIAGLALVHAVGAATTEWSAPNDRSARGRARIMLFGVRHRR